VLRGTRRGAVAALAALALSACGGPATHVRSSPSESTAAWAGKTYVALGDSYTSGPGIGGAPAVSGRPVCGQSADNYPHLVAASLRLSLHDVSCGGAQTGSMTQPQVRANVSVPPQLSALTADTDLVTLGIGANDNQVFMRIVGGCVQLALSDPHGSPCADALGSRAAFAVYRARLTASIVAVVGEIRRRAPQARVLLIGYPQVVPAHGSCAALPLATGDYPFAREANETFNAALSAAARRTGSTYVDVWGAAAGHDICAATPWIAGKLPAEDGLAYHPYAAEQRVVAGLVEKALGQAG